MSINTTTPYSPGMGTPFFLPNSMENGSNPAIPPFNPEANLFLNSSISIPENTLHPAITYRDVKDLSSLASNYIRLANELDKICFEKPSGSSLTKEDFNKLQNLADLNEFLAPDAAKESPLLTAIKVNHLSLALFLVHLGVNPQVFPPNELSPLYLTIKTQKNPLGYELVRCLIKNGASVNVAQIKGITPLHVAAIYDFEMVKILLDLGADPTAMDYLEQTPLDYAHQRFPEPQKMTNLFLKFVNGQLELTHALFREDTRSIDFLLSEGVDPNFIYETNSTPLNYAIMSKNQSAVDLLLKHGADPFFAEEVYQRVFLAHVFGVGEKSLVPFRNGFKEVDLMGMYHQQTIEQITYYFRLFCIERLLPRGFPVQNINSILDTFNHPVIAPHISKIGISSDVALQRIQNNQPVLLLGGTRHHAIDIVIFNNKVMICNRGRGLGMNCMKNAVTVYDCPRNSITTTMINHFITLYPNIESFHQMLYNFRSNHPEIPNLSFELKEQDERNCTWANDKAALFALIEQYSNNPLEAYLTYKEFTQYVREQTLLDYVHSHQDPQKQPLKSDELIQKAYKKLQEKYDY